MTNKQASILYWVLTIVWALIAIIQVGKWFFLHPNGSNHLLWAGIALCGAFICRYRALYHEGKYL
jgi:hypothetical protein